MGSNCARTIDVTHDFERRPTTTETRVAYDNSTWHAMNTTPRRHPQIIVLAIYNQQTFSMDCNNSVCVSRQANEEKETDMGRAYIAGGSSLIPRIMCGAGGGKQRGGGGGSGVSMDYCILSAAIMSGRWTLKKLT